MTSVHSGFPLDILSDFGVPLSVVGNSLLLPKHGYNPVRGETPREQKSMICFILVAIVLLGVSLIVLGVYALGSVLPGGNKCQG
jgi:hypothetical protein